MKDTYSQYFSAISHLYTEPSFDQSSRLRLSSSTSKRVSAASRHPLVRCECQSTFCLVAWLATSNFLASGVGSSTAIMRYKLFLYIAAAMCTSVVILLFISFVCADLRAPHCAVRHPLRPLPDLPSRCRQGRQRLEPRKRHPAPIFPSVKKLPSH